MKERERGRRKGGRDKAKIPEGELEGMQIEAELIMRESWGSMCCH